MDGKKSGYTCEDRFYTYDTPAQIAYCLSCKRARCYNCFNDVLTMKNNHIPAELYKRRK